MLLLKLIALITLCNHLPMQFACVFVLESGVTFSYNLHEGILTAL